MKIVKTWPWRKIITAVACLLVFVGVAPLTYLYLFAATHNFEPLSVPLPLTRGEHSSPVFKTDLNEDYQIDLGWDGSVRGDKKVDLYWKIVSDSGAVIQQGTYNGSLLGNSFNLGYYRPKPGLRQRFILRNLQDPQGLSSAHPIVEIGVPEEGLEMAYGAAAAIRLAEFVSAPGLLLLLCFVLWRRIRRHALAGSD